MDGQEEREIELAHFLLYLRFKAWAESAQAGEARNLEAVEAYTLFSGDTSREGRAAFLAFTGGVSAGIKENRAAAAQIEPEQTHTGTQGNLAALFYEDQKKPYRGHQLTEKAV